MTRQIVLDTETTGLDPAQGHRIIEIGCLELINRQFSGREFHVYINPEREIDPGAVKVHGITQEFLADKPLFSEIADDFLAFIRDAELIIHNAAFDVGFIKAELNRINLHLNFDTDYQVLDTLMIAREKHPGQKNNLDALCKRYNVNNTNRTFHGALLDAELLAFVYLAMTGGQLDMFEQDFAPIHHHSSASRPLSIAQHQTPVILANESELKAHEAFMSALKSGAIS